MGATSGTTSNPAQINQASPPLDRTQWDKRADGSEKGDGFLGILQRPDGGVSSEISVSTDEFGGKEFPTIVPTLSADEVNQLLNMDVQKQQVPRPILLKAADYARQRYKQGLPLFARPGEQNAEMYPQFKRAQVAAKQMKSRSPHTPFFGEDYAQ